MYINKYWGKFIGGSDDSLNLVAFLEDQRKEEIPLSEIFAKTVSYTHLQNLCKGKTVIVVAHRLSALKMCERVAVGNSSSE